MSVKFHKGYWTIFVGGMPQLSYATKEAAESMLAQISHQELTLMKRARFSKLSREARLAFAMLFMVVDEMGRFRGCPEALAMALFPRDDESRARFPEDLAELASANVIRCRRTEQSVSLSIPGFVEHSRGYQQEKAKRLSNDQPQST